MYNPGGEAGQAQSTPSATFAKNSAGMVLLPSADLEKKELFKSVIP